VARRSVSTDKLERRESQDMTWILKYPKTWGFFFWLLSLAAGAAALVLADFGAPAWLFIAIGAWLLTAGLPTLVATLAVASAWGDFPFQCPRLLESPQAAHAAQASLGAEFVRA
jgi:hypothetical protein